MWSNFYTAGGWGMHPTSLFGFLLLAASALHLLRPGRKLTKLVFVLAGVTFASGLLGTSVGVCNAFHYISQVPAAVQIQTLALGCGESLHVLVLALILIVVAGLINAAGLLRRSATPAAP